MPRQISTACTDGQRKHSDLGQPAEPKGGNQPSCPSIDHLEVPGPLPILGGPQPKEADRIVQLLGQNMNEEPTTRRISGSGSVPSGEQATRRASNPSSNESYIGGPTPARWMPATTSMS